MKELVTSIVKTLVDNEEAVVINEVVGNETTILEVTVDKADLGKVIGKEGRNAQSIRTILKAASKKYNKRFMLNIL